MNSDHSLFSQPISCQKIIYGGKLLLDQMTLSEARIPSANEPVVIHLVVFERSTSAPTPMVNAITHSGRVHTGAHLPRMEGVRGSQPVTPVQETVHEDRVDRASSPDQPSQRLVCYEDSLLGLGHCILFQYWCIPVTLPEIVN